MIQSVSQGLSKIVQNCQKLPKIVIRKFCGAVSFHLCDTIGLLSKNCPNLHQIAPNYPKLSKLFKNVHFLVTHSIVFVAIKLQCSKLSFLWLWQLEARHFDWYILMSFWLWNLKDSWSLRVYKARNVLPRKNIKKH